MKRKNNNRYPLGKVIISAFAIAALVVLMVLLKDAPLINAQDVGDADTGAPPVPSKDAELFAIIDRINAIKLDGTIFTDPAFTTLEDLSTIIPKQPVGRDNPFLPLSASGFTLSNLKSAAATSSSPTPKTTMTTKTTMTAR